MPKVALSTTFPFSNYVNTPFEKFPKALLWVPLVDMPVPLNETFQFCEELFNWIKVWRVWRQIYKLYSGIMTHLRNPLCAMDCRIIHYKDRLWLRLSTTQRKQLLDEILKDSTVHGTLKHACENNPIYGICWQNLISLLTLE